MSWGLACTIFRVSWHITAVRDFLHNFILIKILFSFNIDGVEKSTLFSITIVTIIILLLILLSYLDWSLLWASNTQSINFWGWCCRCYIRLTFIPTSITLQHIIFKTIVWGDCVVFISIIVCGQGYSPIHCKRVIIIVLWSCYSHKPQPNYHLYWTILLQPIHHDIYLYLGKGHWEYHHR